MEERTMKVTGKGLLKLCPDMTRITMTLENVKKDYGKAVQTSAEELEILKTMLSKEGFSGEDVKTLSFDIDIENESYSDKDGCWKTRFVGYKYRHVLKIEFPSENEKLGRLLYLLANNREVKPEFYFSFFVRDPEEARNALLDKAVEDAKAKAEILAKAAGITLGNIRFIDYVFEPGDPVMRPMARTLNCKMAAGADTQDTGFAMNITPDDIEMTDMVIVEWSIEN